METAHRFEDHTSEVKLTVTAPTLEQLFAEAGRGLAEILAPEAGAASDALERIELTAPDRDALLVDWLNELVFRTETRGRVYTAFRMESVSDTGLRAQIGGVDLEAIKTPVKAATYHGLRILERPEGWTASVVLDV